jgi:predicted nuclease with TOPRIM domain
MSGPSEKSKLEQKLSKTQRKQEKVQQEQAALHQEAVELQRQADMLRQKLHDITEQNMELIQHIEHGVNRRVTEVADERRAHERANSMMFLSPEKSPMRPAPLQEVRVTTPLPTPSQYLNYNQHISNSPYAKKNLFGNDSKMGRKRRSRSRKSCRCRW